MSSLKIAFLMGACMSLPALADNAAEEIARMNESIAVLSAQKAELELKSQIASKQLELGRIKKADSAARASSAPEPQPTVKGIEGIDGKLSASLLFSDGTQRIVKTGEKIRGGWKIDKITVDSVALVRKKKTVRLGFVHPSTAPHPLPPGPEANSPSFSSGFPNISSALSNSGFPPSPAGR